MENKYFIITVDTEGDNLWTWHNGEKIKTDCAKYLPRFQALCEKYSFKPVYLTNYEMAINDDFVDMAKQCLAKGTCEIGLHLHAWNTPPEYIINAKYDGNPYLIEYPFEVMKEKFDYLYNLIRQRFGVEPVSHRAGRWAMDERYFKILEDYGIRIDCSYTPGINWRSSKGANIGGSDYSLVAGGISMVGKIIEVPMSVCRTKISYNGGFLKKIKILLKGKNTWLRPAVSSLSEMQYVLDMSIKKYGFADFMLHSSELMPTGSPYFPTEQSIESLYKNMEALFAYAREKGYKGILLKDICYENK